MRRAWARGKAFALVPDVPPPESKAVLCCTAREELMALRLRGGGLVPLYPQGAEERERVWLETGAVAGDRATPSAVRCLLAPDTLCQLDH